MKPPIFIVDILLSNPTHVCEVLTMRQVGINRIETETIAVNSGFAHLLVKLVCEHIAFCLDNLERFSFKQMFNSVLHTVSNVFKTEILAETVCVYHSGNLVALTGCLQ